MVVDGHDLELRLRRIEGQVRGIARMVDEGAYCIDVLTQIVAADQALRAAGVLLLDQHLRGCVVAAAQEGGAVADHRIDEASQAIARLVRG
ncbi:MAG: metal-sensitive transcriptional regulator [Propionibacteriaceae bacterium]|nr:metal-sensitive transcriptional regulator [Propionibacteriaceae bacterium]